VRQDWASSGRLPKGVTRLPRPRNGRAYKASIRHGKGIVVHLGLYETEWLAAFAFRTASELLGRERRIAVIPREGQPNAEQVRTITERVRGRLGMTNRPSVRSSVEIPPDGEELMTLFEITVVGFWRREAASAGGETPEAGLDRAASRLVEAARVLFWSRVPGHPEPLDAMVSILSRRLDNAFRDRRLTREVLDDDGDDPWRVARWLVRPDDASGLPFRPFATEIRVLYAEFFMHGTGEDASWSSVLGLSPGFCAEDVRTAYRVKSRSVHPDRGGSDAEFVRLRAAYEEALAFCSARDE
jgi:hypothetical protein